MTVRPADFPPPFDPEEFIAEPSDPPEERIDVGALVVGAGPAGLSAAIRLAQLLEERPDMRERLGEVPIAVVEKGSAPGAHLLSGAVVNPRAFRQLFPGMHTEDMPFRGPVVHEGLYYLTSKRALRLPAPPTMWNHGNHVASLAEMGRWLAERAEEFGVTIVPETAARKLLVAGGRVVGIRTGDRGRGRDGEELPNFEPGSDIRARVTILAEGTQGHLTGVAISRFALASKPQVWALGVKEVWEVPRPLERVIHTMGWPLRGGRKYREFGGSFIYPLGDSMVALGMVVGLDYADATLSVHDLLQELKGHPFVRRILEGGKRVAWGAKTIPEGGFLALPDRFHVPGAMIAGAAMNSLGKFPPRDLSLERDADVPVFVGKRDRSYPQPDGKLFFDKLSSVFLSGNKTRDDAPSHIRIDRKVRREVAETWVHLCPAQVYEVSADASPAGNVVGVEVTASNCIQCGAISAKGGRLTPPEGGDGPEYSLM